MKIKTIFSLCAFTVLGYGSDFYYENGQKVEVTAEVKQERDKSNISYYQTSTGHKVGVTKEILVQCNEGVDCLKVLSKYELNSISSLTERIFLVKISEEKNVFEVSAILHHDTGIALAHPNFIKAKKRR